VDRKKVQLLNDGQSYIKHIEPSAIAELVRSRKFAASTEFSRIKEMEAVIICVPTPLSKNREPHWAHCIVDTRNAMSATRVAPGKIWKA
jgi:UDP-N-acetyl-D-glucosamine dehydrogenase